MADILAPSYPGAVPHIPGGLSGNFTTVRAHYKAKAADAVNDTVKLSQIPKDFVPIGGHIDIIVAGTATLNIDLGITGNLVLFGSDLEGGVIAVLPIAAGLDAKTSKTAVVDLLATLQVVDPGVLEFDVNIWGMVLPGTGVSGT